MKLVRDSLQADREKLTKGVGADDLQNHYSGLGLFDLLTQVVNGSLQVENHLNACQIKSCLEQLADGAELSEIVVAVSAGTPVSAERRYQAFGFV